jgi:ribonucleotide reductase alpha subunit
MPEFSNPVLVEKILNDRYYTPHESKWEHVARRVSRYVASAGIAKGMTLELIKSYEEIFFNMLNDRVFLPNSPTLFNSGYNTDPDLLYCPLGTMTMDDYQAIFDSRHKNGSLSACFVLPVEDSMESIYTTLLEMALVTQAGGGVGFDFSPLRPKGSKVNGAGGVASGVLPFAKAYDVSADAIKQGGKRRAALMGILDYDHPDALDFIAAKKDNDGKSVLSYFNISIDVDPDEFLDALNSDGDIEFHHERTGVTGSIKAKEYLRLIAENAWKSGDPGVVFTSRHNQYSAISNIEMVNATNPCVTGDTLVAVADGRNAVPIKQLAEEGKDVPVYSQGPDGVEIKMGRNPRLTRRQVEVLKVTLDDGSHIRTTPDHEFLLRDGTKIKARDLSEGDSLMPFYKYQLLRNNGTDQRYWYINTNVANNCEPEHRMIAEYIAGKTLRYPEFVTHHKDGDGLNNLWDNIKYMTPGEHMSIHRKDMLGDGNPMRDRWWNSATEEEREQYRQNMSAAVSGENNGMYGREHSEETKALIGQKTSERMTPEARRRVGEWIKKYQEENGTDYLRENRVERIQFVCQWCGKEYELTPGEYRKKLAGGKYVSACGISCSQHLYAETHDQSRFSAEQIVEWGVRYHRETSDLPTANGWDAWTKKNPEVCSREAVRKYVGGFKALKEAVGNYNHRVMGVERDGIEDVYNITVDDNHTVAYITNPNAATRSGAPKLSGIMQRNCGEQQLPAHGSCNLGSVDVSKIDGDIALFGYYTMMATVFLDNVVDINVFPLDKLHQKNSYYRDIGLGLMGVHDYLIGEGLEYDSQAGRFAVAKLAARLSMNAYLMSAILAKNYGAAPAYKDSRWAKEPEFLPFPMIDHPEMEEVNQQMRSAFGTLRAVGLRNISVTTIAPTGTLSQIAECSSGIEPNFLFVYDRTMVSNTGEDVNLRFIHKNLGSFATPEQVGEIMSAGSVYAVTGDPVYKSAMEIAPEDHLMMQAAAQAYLSNSISKTANMPNDATVEDVERIFKLAMKLFVKGVTVFRDGSLLGGQVLNAPKPKKEKVLFFTDAPQMSNPSSNCPECQVL